MQNPFDTKSTNNPLRVKYNRTPSNLQITSNLSTQIWQPDLTVYNSAEPNIVDHFAKTNKIVYYNGYVLWVSLQKNQFHIELA